MATSYATPGDVATRLGGLTFTASEISQATALLDDVSEVMRAELPLLDTWIADGKTTAGLARAICCQLAMQAITISTVGVGVRQETHPEHSVTFSDAATEGLSLTEKQIAQLTPDETERPRAFSITPG